MKGQNNRSSLFEGRPHLHHFATEQDVAEEFYELLRSKGAFIFKTS